MNPRLRPVTTPIIIGDLMELNLMPSELTGFPKKLTCQIIGIENVNIKEPKIPLKSRMAGKKIATNEIHKRKITL
jgi:hypothetical protein